MQEEACVALSTSALISHRQSAITPIAVRVSVPPSGACRLPTRSNRRRSRGCLARCAAIAAGVFAALRAASRRSRVDRRQRPDTAARAGADDRRGDAPRGGGARRARARRRRRHADGGAAARDRAARAHGRRALATRRAALAPLPHRRFSSTLDDARRAKCEGTTAPQKPLFDLQTLRSCGRCVQALGVEDARRAGGAARRRSRRRGWGGRRCVWQAIARGEDIRPLVPMLDGRAVRGVARSRVADRGARAAVVRADAAARAAVDAARAARSRRGGAARAAAAASRARCTRGGWSCRRRCATCARCARWRCSISNRTRPPAAIDRVTIVIDPTPGRVLQHTLFTRAQPTPEQLSTLLARLGALMGQDRFGAPALVDTVSSRRVRDDAVCHRSRRTERTAETAKHAKKITTQRRPVAVSASSANSAVRSTADRVRRCADAASRCPRASRSLEAGRCASPPTAAASPAAP